MKKSLKLLAFSLFLVPFIGNAQIRIIGTGIGTATTVNATLTDSTNVIIGKGTASTGTFNTFVGKDAGKYNGNGYNNTFLGYQTGYNNVIGAGNTFVGSASGSSNTAGSGNTFIGSGSGKQNTYGGANLFAGYSSGFNNQNGSDNTYLGHESGYQGTAAERNTFTGKASGFMNSSGNDNAYYGFGSGGLSNSNSNSFYGSMSGFNNTGAENTFIGFRSGYNNTANSNCFFGVRSGEGNTSGNKNSFFGLRAGQANTIGNLNTFMGYNSGYNNTASNNSFFGSSSGEGNTSGTKNSFFGTGTGQINTIGSLNTFMGYNSGYNNTASNNSFFGTSSGEGNTSGDKNSFFGTGAGQINSIGSLNTFMGFNSGYNTWGNGNTFLGQEAGKSNAGGSNNTALGAASDVGFANGQYLTAIGSGATVSASSNAMVLGGTDLTSPPTHVNVGIGTSGPTANLHLESNTARELILEHARKDDEVAAFNLRAGIPSSSGNEKDLLITLNAPAANMAIAGYGLYPQAMPTLATNPAPLLPWNNLAMIATKHSPLYIGTYQTQTLDYAQNIHFVTGVNTSTAPAPVALTPWECVRINKLNGFVGVHTRNTGSGDPQALFHVNLTNPGKYNLNTATEGIRFQGLPIISHTNVVVIDAQGNLAQYPISTIGSGGSITCASMTNCAWGLYGNTIGGLTPTVYIGTNDNQDFRMYTAGQHRARITNDGNWDFGLSNTFTGVGTRTMTGTFGFRNNINKHVKVSFAFGQDNTIDNSDAVLVSGSNNLVSNASPGVLAAGSWNKVNNGSSNSTALGEGNLIDQSVRAIVTGHENIIRNTSDNAGALGENNLIEKSKSSFALGKDNKIIMSTGHSAVALGAKNVITGSNESVALGEDNEINNAHGTIMAGGHNKSDGSYNVVIGHMLRASTTAPAMTSMGTTGENIMIIGEEINNDLRHSLVTGFTGNRTTVTTNMGLAVQLDPNGLNTYRPTVNFEVDADPAGALGPGPLPPPSPIRSNIRFHNLPNAPESLPAVLIDPATGELFMANRKYARPGNDSNENPNEAFLETIKQQQKQLDDQQKQINDLMTLVKTGFTSNGSVPTINVALTDKDVIVLDQNIPNPFDSQTIIGYNIPTNVKVAHIVIRNLDGKVLKDITITDRGRGIINIYQSDVATGIYVYSLIADDKVIDTKKMEFVK